MKRIQLGHIVLGDIDSIRKEALILERLTHSPRILDIYGYCSTTIFTEPMAADLHLKIAIYITTVSRLKRNWTSLMMFTHLHGFEGGTIIQADTHMEQWLLDFDGSIKLNDFNNAREPMWDDRKKKYCRKHSTYGGIWRSHEKYNGNAQDESIDTYAYGNGIYPLVSGITGIAHLTASLSITCSWRSQPFFYDSTKLTGLWSYYDEEYDEEDHDKIRVSCDRSARAS